MNDVPNIPEHVKELLAKQRELERLERIANQRIEEISGNPSLTLAEKRELIGKLRNAIATGSIASINEALTQVKVAETVAESEIEPETLAIAYGLNMADAARVQQMAARIDLNSPVSIRNFADAMADTRLPEPLRSQLVADHTAHIQKHPGMVEAWNAASEKARIEASADYIRAKNQFDALTNNPNYAGAKEILEVADYLGLEANREVQKLLLKASKGQLTDTELATQLTPHIVQQKKRLIEEIVSAKETVLESHPEKVSLIGGDAEEIMDIARKAMRAKRKDPNYQFTPREEANIEVFLLSRETVLTKALGNNALTIDKGISLEKEAGTLEQRTDRAMKVLQENMPPELSGLAEKNPDKLRRMVQETLKEADERGLKVSEVDTLKGKELYAYAASVHADVQREINRFATQARDAGVSAVQPADAENKTPAQVAWAVPQSPTIQRG